MVRYIITLSGQEKRSNSWSGLVADGRNLTITGLHPATQYPNYFIIVYC